LSFIPPGALLFVYFGISSSWSITSL